MEMKKASLPAPAFHKEYTLPRAERSPDRHYSHCPPLSKDDYSEKDPTGEMEKKKKAPLPAPPIYKGCYVIRAERSPDRRYLPYPPPSPCKDGYYGKNAGSWALSPNYFRPPSDVLRVNWINKEQYITELFAAMEKQLMHTSTRPQFGPNVSAEYVIDPVFKDVGFDMSVYGYLLPLLGHKVASAAEVPNSAGKDPTGEMEKKKKAPLPAPPIYKGCYVPRAERSPDRRYLPYPPPSPCKDGYYGKNAGSWALSPNYFRPPSDVLRVNWINKEQYITELFAAMEKQLMHTSTRPQFGPNVSAEYVLDPVFKDVGFDMSVYGYLLPLLGHKVASAAEVPNSAGKDPTGEMEKKKKAPLPAPPIYKGCYVPRAERSPDRRYLPYPPPSPCKDGYYGKNAGSWALSPNYFRPPSDVLRVNWINKEQYITELFAAMEKLMHTSTRPQFGPNVSAEYVLDPVFKDVGFDMSVYGYLLPLLGHKVASAAEAPNSAGKVGTTTGYWQRDGSIEVPVREVAALKISEN